MINKQQSIKKSRLGKILTNGAYISSEQLESALCYQAKRQIKLGTALLELKFISRRQLNFALTRQSWTRAIAASIAIAIAPFNFAMASENTKTGAVKESVFQKSTTHPNSSSDKYASNIYFSAIQIEPQLEQFKINDNSGGQFAINKKISKSSGMQFMLFSKHTDNGGSNVSYQFSPEISLFKTSSSSRTNKYSARRNGVGLDHYRNTTPVVFMLTLKGRSLLENSGKNTKMWSLDRAKKGVQRKSMLMFSVTKQF